jgi:hypothetical protein
MFNVVETEENQDKLWNILSEEAEVKRNRGCS